MIITASATYCPVVSGPDCVVGYKPIWLGLRVIKPYETNEYLSNNN
jgi:hypothetical protein